MTDKSFSRGKPPTRVQTPEFAASFSRNQSDWQPLTARSLAACRKGYTQLRQVSDLKDVVADPDPFGHRSRYVLL